MIKKRTSKHIYRLWSLDLNVQGNPSWIHRSGYFYDARSYDKIRITKKTLSQLKDAKVCNCLINMRIDTEQYNFTAAGIPLIKKAHIICDDIKFHCTKKPEQHHSIWDCIDNMCKGKCPYKIAHKLYPNKYKTK